MPYHGRMDAVLAALESAAETGLIPTGAAVLLAVSGGADSTALLHAAAEIAGQTGWILSVGHVHHGWRAREADRDLAFVAEQARRLRLPFAARREDARGEARRLGLSPEAGARHVRYRALGAIAAETGCDLVATAHQRDDALESHVIALRRRGGVARLAGPRIRRDDGVVRPLLQVGRTEILAFLAERSLPFRRDATNGNLRLERNRVRRDLAALDEPARRALEAALDASRERARVLEDALAASILPTFRASPGGGWMEADASSLQSADEDLRRLAIDRLTAPFARPGRPPTTGREREALVARLGSGADFRFEAGRRIRFERRRGRLRVWLTAASPRAAASFEKSAIGRA
jgi:tRNA(Ile)-lysidine synthetase-like protein